jgi:hypothetical protein
MRIFGDSHQPACLDLTQMAAYFCLCAKATEPNVGSIPLGILNAKAQRKPRRKLRSGRNSGAVPGFLGWVMAIKKARSALGGSGLCLPCRVALEWLKKAIQPESIKIVSCVGKLQCRPR